MLPIKVFGPRRAVGVYQSLMLPACWDRASSNYGISACVCGLQVFQYFISRVREKLHIVLCMSPAGDAFRSRCRMFPSLVNCCTIDWFVQVCMLSFHKNCISLPLLKPYLSLSPLLHSGLVRPCSPSHRPSSRMWILGARSRNRTSQPCAWKYMLVSLTWLSASTQSWDADTTLPLPHTWSSSTSTCPCWRIRGSTKFLWVQPSQCTSSYQHKWLVVSVGIDGESLPYIFTEDRAFFLIISVFVDVELSCTLS